MRACIACIYLRVGAHGDSTQSPETSMERFVACIGFFGLALRCDVGRELSY